MHANVTSDRGGGSGGGSWRLPADETLQVGADPKEKLEVSTQFHPQNSQAIENPLKHKNETKYFHVAGPQLWRIIQLEEYCTCITSNRRCDSRHRDCNLPFRVIHIPLFFSISIFCIWVGNRFVHCSIPTATLLMQMLFCNSYSPCRYVDELLYWSGRRMLLDEYLQGDLSPHRLPPTWVSRTKFVFQSDDGSLAVYETTNNSVKTLVSNHTLVSWSRH